MKVDFTKLVLKDINGMPQKPDKPFYKTVANIIYMQISNLDLVEIAMQINRGEPVELSKTDMSQIEACLMSEKAGFFAFAKKAIKDFFKDIGTDS